MAGFNKFNCFVEDVAHGAHNLAVDVLKVALSSVQPSADAAVLTDISQLPTGNGYLAGGNAAVLQSSAQVGGVYSLALVDPATWVATDGPLGPLRYAVLYNATAGRLIGWWDYGQSITLSAKETFKADFGDQVLTLQ